MRRVVVCARDARQAQNWAREQGLAPREWIYPTVSNVVGISEFVTVVLDGFFDRRESFDVFDAIKWQERKQGGRREWEALVGETGGTSEP